MVSVICSNSIVGIICSNSIVGRIYSNQIVNASFNEMANHCLSWSNAPSMIVFCYKSLWSEIDLNTELHNNLRFSLLTHSVQSDLLTKSHLIWFVQFKMIERLKLLSVFIFAILVPINNYVIASHVSLLCFSFNYCYLDFVFIFCNLYIYLTLFKLTFFISKVDRS